MSGSRGERIRAAIGRLADRMPHGHLQAEATPEVFLDAVAAEIDRPCAALAAATTLRPEPDHTPRRVYCWRVGGPVTLTASYAACPECGSHRHDEELGTTCGRCVSIPGRGGLPCTLLVGHGGPCEAPA